MNRRDVLLGAAGLAACSPEARSQAAVAPFPMRRGVNLGNALEAPNEGDWGYRIELPHLDAIRAAGFDGIRLPVRWDAHAGSTPPYAFGGDFWRRIDEIVEHALALGLKVQIDMHHLQWAEGRAPNTDRFLGMWSGIAHHFRGAPAGLMLEPFNEPNGPNWGNGALMALQRDVVEVIRDRGGPYRLIVLGPGNWQNIDALRDWRPPPGENIAVSVHYYEPHAFTHQNAEWLGADAPNFGREWGTAEDRAQVREHLMSAVDWGVRHGYAMQLGEFGVNRALPIQQRAQWTRTVREICEANNMAWCVWDFAGAFPIWDRETGAFIPMMRDALFA